MDIKKACQHCGKTLGPEAIEGLCPDCLMKMGLGINTEASEAGPQGKRLFTPPTLVELASRFPQFEILAFIGQGGMGAVYKARQRQLDRVVALKILPPGIGEESAFADRFAREAKAMAKLNHSGIVTIYDFGNADGLYYFIMELVDGVNLRLLMQNGRVSPREALAIVPQICDALQYAHDQGIVHRDIKPENILLDRQGRVKVADFGLAKLVGAGSEPVTAGVTTDSSSLTEAGKVMGTPHYMAPEQLTHPGEVDHRADIYALGAVFYQMLTGELPAKRIEPPSRKVQIDVRLDDVVLRALEKEPEHRYQQVSQVKTAVEMIGQTTGWNETKSEPKTTLTKMLSSNQKVLVISGLLLMGVLGYTVFRSRNLQVAVKNDGQKARDHLTKQLESYKANHSSALTRATHRSLTFGPVIERTLTINGNQCDFLLLRTGEVLHHSFVDGDLYDDTPFLQWVRAKGVDIGFCVGIDWHKKNAPYGLGTFGMGAFWFPRDTVPDAEIPRFRSMAEFLEYNSSHPDHPATNARIGALVGVTNIWNDLTADHLHGPPDDGPAFFLKEKHLMLYFAPNDLRHPIAFSTREGIRGIMQVTGFTDNPRSVKLRYKLVEQTPRQIPEWAKRKPLNEWIADLQKPDTKAKEVAEHAIAELGTNALPEFLKILADQDPTDEGWDRRHNTAAALRFIGPDLKSAIPSFTSLLLIGNQYTSCAGAEALAVTARIAPEAFAQLTNKLIAPSEGVRSAATHGVSLLLASESNHLAEPALPALLHNLNDEAKNVREGAAFTLLDYLNTQRYYMRDLKPDLIIPALIGLLQDNKYSDSRLHAVMLLEYYGEKAKVAAPLLTNLLNDPNNELKGFVTNILKRIGHPPAAGTDLVPR